MQECITPRCVFSREDAMFCARILLKFAELNAANFSLPFMVNAVFSEVLCLLRACTLQETVHLSVFIKEVFHILERTSDERWVAEHPVIGQSGKALSLDEWEKLQRKFQVRSCSCSLAAACGTAERLLACSRVCLPGCALMAVCAVPWSQRSRSDVAVAAVATGAVCAEAHEQHAFVDSAGRQE
jgi:Transcription factor/nuclear export subunit protein 2